MPVSRQGSLSFQSARALLLLAAIVLTADLGCRRQPGGAPGRPVTVGPGFATAKGVTRHVQGALTPERSVHTTGVYLNVSRPRCEVALLGLGADRGSASTVSCAVYVQPEGEEQERLTQADVQVPADEWRRFVFDLASYERKKCLITITSAAPPDAAYRVLVSVAIYQARSENAHNVLLVSLDGLRADHLGCYGYSVPTSPTLDRLAREGVRFARCNSQAPWNFPALFSMMGADFPSVLWAEQPIGERARRYVADPLMLPAVLKSAAYYTGAITEGGPAGPEGGLHQGFDTYRVVTLPSIEETCRVACAWVQEHAEDRFFLFVQSYEVYRRPERGPFAPRGPGEQELAIAAYDSSILHADAVLGVLCAKLEALNLLDRTLLIVTSAHGWEFGPAAQKNEIPGRLPGGFGQTLSQSLLHVPLIMRAPALAPPGRTIEYPAALMDVLPTVLGLLGFEAPKELPGRAGANLAALVRGDAATLEERAIFSEATCWGPERKAILAGRYKLVYTPTPWRTLPAAEKRMRTPAGLDPAQLDAAFDAGCIELYDLQTDPEEQHNLAVAAPETTGRCMALMEAVLERNTSLRQGYSSRVVGYGSGGGDGGGDPQAGGLQ